MSKIHNSVKTLCSWATLRGRLGYFKFEKSVLTILLLNSSK